MKRGEGQGEISVQGGWRRWSTYFTLDVLLLILVVVGLHAELQLLDELLLRVFVYNTVKEATTD